MWFVVGMALAGPGDAAAQVEQVMVEARTSVRVQQLIAEAELSFWANLFSEGRMIELALVVDRPFLSEILVTRARIHAEITRVSAVYGPKHPESIALEAQAAGIEAQLETGLQQMLESKRIQVQLLMEKQAILGGTSPE